MNNRLLSYNLSLLLPLSAILVFAVLLVCGVFLSYLNTRELTDQQLRQNIEISAKRLQLRLEMLQANNDTENLERELAYFNLNPQLDAVALIDDRGTVIAAGQRRWKNRPASESVPDYDPEHARKSLDTLTLRLYSDAPENRSFVYAPVYLDVKDKKLRSHRLGVIFSSYNHKNLHLNLWQYTVNQGALAWISTLLAVALLFYIQRLAVGKPLLRLRTYAEKIGEGVLTLSNPLTGQGELFELGQILEQTSRKLSDTLSILERREQKLVVTLQSIGDALITTDKAGIITRMNSRAERLTGWSASEAIGQVAGRNLHQRINEGAGRGQCASLGEGQPQVVTYQGEKEGNPADAERLEALADDDKRDIEQPLAPRQFFPQSALLLSNQYIRR